MRRSGPEQKEFRKLELRDPNIHQLSHLVSEETERTLLGAILLDNEKLPVVQDRVTPHTFYLQSHRAIFDAICTIVERGDNADVVSLGRHLADSKKLAGVGGTAYLWSLTESMPRGMKVDTYARILSECERYRNLVELLHAAHDRIVSVGGEPVNTLIGDLEREILGQMQGAPQDERDPTRLLQDTIAELERDKARLAQAEGSLGVSMGLNGLDSATTGYREGEYWVIGARTGDGKTALMGQQAVENVAAGRKVSIMSIELRAEDMLQRMIATKAEMDYSLLRDPRKMEHADMVRVMETGADLIEGLRINDGARMTLGQLEARVRLHIMQGANIVYVDYLQKLRLPKGEKRYDFITEASETLCGIAKMTRTPIVVLSQLSRPQGFRKSASSRPTLNDLKESGQIENDAFGVVLLYRPRDKNGYTREDEIILAKQRNGAPMTLDVEYVGEHLRFKPRYLSVVKH